MQMITAIFRSVCPMPSNMCAGHASSSSMPASYSRARDGDWPHINTVHNFNVQHLDKTNFVLKHPITCLPFNRRQSPCECAYLITSYDVFTPVTLTLWPWYTDDLMTLIYELDQDISAYQQWSFWVKAFQTNRTDRQTDRQHWIHSRLVTIH